MKNMIIAHNGSVQNIPGIPDDVKAIYKTVWEISQKKVIDLAADRGAFICQSQSMNIHLQAPTLGQLTSMHFYGWKKGLKTGMYYLRTRPAAQAIQFTVDQSVLNDAKTQQTNATNVRNAAEVVTAKGTGIPTPTSSTSSSPVRSPITPVKPSTNDSASLAIKQEPVTPSLRFSPSPPTTSVEQGLTSLSLDEKVQKAADADPEFAAALQRQKERELEEAKLICSLDNKEACLMCSG
jgi:ribonucleoside-diphosphate reductase subunit M1